MSLKVVGITDNLNSADSWWRLISPFNALKKSGVDARICWLDSTEMPTESVYNSVVVLQQVLVRGGENYINEWMNQLRRRGARSIIYELDDDTLSPAYVTHMLTCGRITPSSAQTLEDERIRQIAAVKACNAVTVTTPRLAKVVREYTDVPIYIVPNAIDVDWFISHLGPEHIETDKLTIGWAGGLRPEEDLEPVAEAWGQIAIENKDVMFVVAGWQPNPFYEHVPLERIIRRPYKAIELWPENMRMNIGCCALTNTPFNRCKSPIKAFEYGLADAAVVASSTVYEFELMPKVTGSIVYEHTADGWYKALKDLVDNKDRREGLAKLLKKDIILNHNLDSRFDDWISVYAHEYDNAKVNAR